MLELAVALQLFLGQLLEAGVVTALLVFNAAVAFIQEGLADSFTHLDVEPHGSKPILV
jgi:H+-transporting ATPase